MNTIIERKLYKKINTFIRSFNPTVRLKIENDEFAYDLKTNSVIIDLDEIIFIPHDEALDKKVLKENGFIFDISMPTFFLLHEVAHSLLNQNDFEMYKMQKGAISLIECDYTRHKLYREIDDEKQADRLAYDLYLHNYDFVKSFDRTILEIIGEA
jgi:hypothetical protein